MWSRYNQGYCKVILTRRFPNSPFKADDSDRQNVQDHDLETSSESFISHEKQTLIKDAFENGFFSAALEVVVV